MPYMILGKVYTLSELSFSHWQNEDDSSNLLTCVLWALRVISHEKYLEHDKHSNVIINEKTEGN